MEIIAVIVLCLIAFYLAIDYISKKEKEKKGGILPQQEIQKIHYNILEKEYTTFNTIIQGEKIEIDLTENSIEKLLLTLNELKEKKYNDIFIENSKCCANTIDIYPYKNKTKKELTDEITSYYSNKTLEIISRI